MLLSLLLLLLSERISGVQIAIALYTSEDSPEDEKSKESFNMWWPYHQKKLTHYTHRANLYCLFALAGLVLVARSLGKATNSSSSMFRLLRCSWSRVLSKKRTAAWTIARQRASSLNGTSGCGPVGLVNSGVMPVKQQHRESKSKYKQLYCWFCSLCA